MKKNKKNSLILKRIKKCPICDSNQLVTISNIKSSIKEIGSKFDLIECVYCTHRTISKIPEERYLKNLYKNDSSLVFGGVHSELKQKKDFMLGNFKKVKPYFNHWIFDHLDKKKGNYFELGPGLCRLYKAFFDNGWKCQGLELRSFIKAPGLKRNLKKIHNKQDVVVAFDVIEHVINPIKYLKNIRKKIKTNGKVFLTFPNSDSYKSKILKDKWAMVAPLAHIHYFSKNSTKLMLSKYGFEVILIKDFSYVIPRRLIRNILKLPFLILTDLISLKFKKIFFRLGEMSLNILDLIKGDQLKVIAKRI